MRPHVYETPQAFKVALEQRLRNVSRSGADFSVVDNCSFSIASLLVSPSPSVTL